MSEAVPAAGRAAATARVLLVEVARRLRHGLREEDTVARLGGDEFTVIMEGVGDAAAVDEVATKVRRLLGPPLQVEDETRRVGASVGIAIFPDDAEAPDEMVRLADRAMYRQKRARR